MSSSCLCLPSSRSLGSHEGGLSMCCRSLGRATGGEAAGDATGAGDNSRRTLREHLTAASSSNSSGGLQGAVVRQADEPVPYIPAASSL